MCMQTLQLQMGAASQRSQVVPRVQVAGLARGEEVARGGVMKAADYLKKMRKRREQTYGPDRDMVDVLIYLLVRLDAEEQDVARQLQVEDMHEGGING